MRKRQELEARNFEALVKQRLLDGWSVSAIAKDSGKSYKHVKRIVDRIRAS